MKPIIISRSSLSRPESIKDNIPEGKGGVYCFDKTKRVEGFECHATTDIGKTEDLRGTILDKCSTMNLDNVNFVQFAVIEDEQLRSHLERCMHAVFGTRD
jgi:hypothetical protein